MNRPLIAIVVAVFMAFVHVPATAQSPAPGQAQAESVPALLAKANQAYANKNYEALVAALERIHVMRPYNSEYMYRLVLAYALLDDKSKAYDLMLRMQQQGLAYDFMASEDSRNVRGTEVFEYVNNLMQLAAEPFGESEIAFNIQDAGVLPSSLAWDPTRQRFLVGTIATGQVLAVDDSGQVEELIKADADNGMWAVIDVLVDEQRDRLWVTSAAIPAFAGFGVADKGRSSLFEFELESLKLVQSYAVPVDGRPHALGSMAMGPDGTVFIADRALPAIYVKLPVEKKITPFVFSREMVSQRGIAMQPDGRIMYVADRELGILVVDLVRKRAAKLAVPETLNVGGIDELLLWNNHLIIVQNGISPQRVMRLALHASGTRVESVAPLAVAQPEFNFPSFGTLRGDDLFFFANSGMASSGEGRPVAVLRTAVNATADLVSPEMELFLEQQRQREAELIEQRMKKN